jgi:phage shock protein E
MRYYVPALTFSLLLLTAVSAADEKQPMPIPNPNPNIDMDGYLKVAAEAAKHRQTRRLSEDDFIKMSKEPGVIVLDARSKEMFELIHVEGAINLSFPNIDIESLKKMLPDKDARILIYCNNNFSGAKLLFPGKGATASLNLSTYIALYNYGYHNVYELGPLVDLKDSKLPWAGLQAPKQK